MRLRALTAEDIATYPDYDAVTARVARWFGVAADRVTLTNGLDDGLHAVAQCGAWHADGPARVGATAPPQFVLAEPAFEMFEELRGVVRRRARARRRQARTSGFR